MGNYRILRHGQLWGVYVPGRCGAILTSDDRTHLIAWACELAQDYGGDVDVYHEDGRLEMTYSYSSGVEIKRAP